MMKLSDIKNIYFLGIGGIGMSALARYFKANGVQVSGYDKTKTSLTEELIKEGILVHFEDDVNSLPQEIDLVIYTPAIPAEHKEFRFLKEKGYQMMKRAEILGLITGDSFTVAVAGTHGKTTTTSMIAHILKQSGKDVFSFIGGITKNYNSNLILSEKNSLAIVEADEFDRSFLHLRPDIAVISSMDADHLDIYGSKDYMVESFKLFADRIKPGGKFRACRPTYVRQITPTARHTSGTWNRRPARWAGLSSQTHFWYLGRPSPPPTSSSPPLEYFVSQNRAQRAQRYRTGACMCRTDDGQKG